MALAAQGHEPTCWWFRDTGLFADRRCASSTTEPRVPISGCAGPVWKISWARKAATSCCGLAGGIFCRREQWSHDPFDCFVGRAYAFAAPHASFVASVRHSVIWRCASPKARRSLATRSMKEGVAYHGFVLLPSIKLAGPAMTFGSR